MTILAAADPTKVLFETRLLEQEGRDVKRFQGSRLGSRLSFGEPAIYDLVTALKESGAEPGFEISSQLDRYEFLLVRLVATLHVEAHSAVGWFKVRVGLTPAVPPGGRGGIAIDDPAQAPIAHDLYPLLVVDKVVVEHSAKISPSLKFGEAEVSPGEASLAVKYERLEPRITAYGKREAEVYWRYTPGVANEVAGGVRQMDLIVRRPRGVPTRATVFAEGSGRQWGIFPQTTTTEDQQFDL